MTFYNFSLVASCVVPQSTGGLVFSLSVKTCLSRNRHWTIFLNLETLDSRVPPFVVPPYVPWHENDGTENERPQDIFQASRVQTMSERLNLRFFTSSDRLRDKRSPRTCVHFSSSRDSRPMVGKLEGFGLSGPC